MLDRIDPLLGRRLVEVYGSRRCGGVDARYLSCDLPSGHEGACFADPGVRTRGAGRVIPRRRETSRAA